MDLHQYADGVLTIVDVDMVDYSNIAFILDENAGTDAVSRLNDEIQGFIDSGLAAVACLREQSVSQTTGDGAILVFKEVSDAHRFAEAVYQAAREHNERVRKQESKRYFRIGAATGKVLTADGKLAGTKIIEAVRFESRARAGEFVIDLNTYRSLPEDLQSRYLDEEEVEAKGELFSVRRTVMMNVPSDLTAQVPADTDASGDLTPYVSNVIDALCEESSDDSSGTRLADPRKTFVATKCDPLFRDTAGNGSGTDAFGWLTNRASAGDSVLVLSNYGMGKTHLVLRLFSNLAESAARAPGNRIPVFIPLRQVNYHANMERPELVRQLWSIAYSYGLPVSDDREFELRLAEGAFWLILDGIDEIPLVQIESNPVAVIRQLRTLLGDKCPILFTSRPGLFATRIEELNEIFAANACLLALWDQGLWESFLEHCYRSHVFSSLADYQQFQHRVASSPHLREFIVTPLYARMLVDARATLISETSFDVTDLYQEYVHAVLNRRIIAGIPNATRVACLQAIAVHLCRNRRSEADLDEIAQLAHRLADDIGLADIRRIVEHDLTRTSLLVSQGDNRLWFSHKSFFEYFAALSVLGELASDPPWKQSQLLKHPLEEGILTFVGIHLSRSEYQAARDTCLGELASIRAQLLDENIVRNLTKALLSAGCDLSGLQLKKASLSGLDLSRSTMKETNFEGAFLADCNLEGSDLKRCRFVRTHLTNCRLADVDLSGSVLKSCFLEQLDKSGFSPCLANVVIERARMSREDGRHLEAAMLQSDGWIDEEAMRNAIAEMKRTARWTD